MNGLADPQETGPRREDGSEKTSELAIAALFLSIVWLFGVGAIAGIVLARMSLREIRASEGRLGGRSLAISAIAVGVFGLISLGLVVAIGIDAGG